MPAQNGPEDVGVWSNQFDWPLIGLHLVLTPDRKILTFGTEADGTQSGLHIYDVWDPITNTHTTLEHHTNSDIFCTAAIIIPETDEILLAGGDARPFGAINAGIPDVNIYDPTDMSLEVSSTGPMAFSRWYGTAVTLATGQIVMIGGRSDAFPTFEYSGYPEIYTPGEGWRTLTGAYIEDFAVGSLYPRSWVTSKGDIWTYSDSSNKVYSIHLDGSGSAEMIGVNPTGITWNRPAVTYDQDKVLLIGDDGSAWIMDLSGDTPAYTRTEDVGPGRVWSNLTVLADGRVMVSGGSAVDNELVGVNNTVKIWDPDTGHWTVEADAATPRLYHSSTILLPDGTVLSLGGGAPGPLVNLNGERYTPDYLFENGGAPAVRPVITAAPADLAVGQDFDVSVTGGVVTLALMKFGAVTHSFNMSSLRLELPFTVNPDGSLHVDLPDNVNVLTPGYWMLFALDADGTPSIAATIKIAASTPDYEPATPALDLGVGMKQSGSAAYDGYDDTFLLTPPAPNKAGGVMSSERVDLSQAFHIAFQINLGDKDAGADGMAFVLHNDPNGASALGDFGGGLGASGILNGLAIQFDAFQNAEDATDIANDHTGLFDTDDGTLVTPVVDLGNIEDGAWHDVELTWDGAVLTYLFDGVEIAQVTIDIATEFLGGSHFAYFGFTGGTGGLIEEHRVRVNQIDATLEDGDMVHADRGEVGHVPAFVVNGDAAVGGGTHAFVLTPDVATKTGSVMSATRVDLAESFTLTFEINLGDKDALGADGMAFVLHNDPDGANAIGGPGGAMGALNLLNGLAIQFDVYQNAADPNDIANDHTSFIDTDSELPVSPIEDLGNIEDGAWHSVTVAWDGDMLVYSVDGVEMGMLHQDIVANYLGGSRFAYFGFTAATGGLSNEMQVRLVSMNATAENGTHLQLKGPNTPPVAVNDAYVVAENGTLVVNALGGVLANDSDPDGDGLHTEIEAMLGHHGSMYPEHGTLTLNPDGSFTYTPDAGFVGTDHFHYYASDGKSRTDAKATITVTAAGVAETYTVAQYLAAGTIAADKYAVLADTGANIAGLSVAQFGALGANGIDAIDATDNLLSLTVGKYQALGGVALSGNDTVTLADSGAELAGLTTSQIAALAGKGVDKVDATDGTLSLTVSKALSLGAVDLTAADTVVLADTDLNIASLTSGELAALAAKGFDRIDSTNDVVRLNVAEFNALGALALTAADAVTIADTSTALATLTAAQIAGMAAKGVDKIESLHGTLSFTAAKYLALGSVALVPANVVALGDTGANIAQLTAAQIDGLDAKGFDQIDAADDKLSLTVAKFNALGSVALMADDAVTLADTGAKLAALSPADLAALYFAGIDAIDATNDALSVSLAQYQAMGLLTLAASDVVTVNGTSAAEMISGRAAAEFVKGEGGGDALLGEGGRDTLAGGLGNDTMTGGDGKDRFLFDTKAHSAKNVDTITDFSVVDDTIVIDHAIYTKLAKGDLAGSAFYKGAAAHDANDRIIYNAKTGALIYDSNGDASGGAVQFASLVKGLALTAHDFLVV